MELGRPGEVGLGSKGQVGMDQETQVRQSVAAIKALIGRLPAGSFQVTSEEWGYEIVQRDDYPILWEIKIAPKNPNAFPIGVLISVQDDLTLTYGLLFDSQEAVEKRLGLRISKWASHALAFGTEPTDISLDTALNILSSVFEGQVILRYILIGKLLVDIAAEVATMDGTERFGGGMLISYFQGETFQYESWN